MRARLGLLIALLALAACGGGPPTSATTPSPTHTFEPTSPETPVPTASGPPSLVHCTVAVPAGDNLVIGSVVGDPTIVVRDIQDPANAHNLCTFDANTISPQFVSATQIAYDTPDARIIKAELTTGVTVVLASHSGGINWGQFAFSPDARSLTYLDRNVWHLAGPSGDRIVATLPSPPARDVNPDQDDRFLAYSPDGQYIAMFNSFLTGGSGQSAPDQIRRAGDGSLVYSTSGMTMAVWASTPSRLYFRDSTGHVKRWDPSGSLSTMTTLQWIRPRSSPDGRWIAYSFRTISGIYGVGIYGVQANGVANTTPPGRGEVRFLTNDLIWYEGLRACSTCLPGQLQPTGVTYIYDIAGASEVTARLSAVYDAWPHVTAPGL